MRRFIAIWILLSAGLNIWQMGRIAELEEKRPIVIYKADNQDRYPYTRSQRVEETADYYTYADGIYFTSHVLKNRLTREIKAKEVE